MMIDKITDIGDSLVMGCIAITGAIYLLLHGYRRGAAALIMAFVAAAGFIGLTKLAFIGCSIQLHNTYELRSPSGHSAISAAVLGTYIFIISGQLRGVWRLLPPALLIPLILAIAISRIVLNMHSISEVIVGLAVGSLTLVGIHAFLSRGKKPEQLNVYTFILYAVLVATVLHGFRLKAEDFVDYLASFITTHVAFCAR